MPNRLAIVLTVVLTAAAAVSPGAEPAPAQTPATPPTAPEFRRDVLLDRGWTIKLPLGFRPSAAHIPQDNGMSDQKAALGKLLYYDTRLSKDSAVSCGTCHNPFHGFAGPDRIPRGAAGKTARRNAPTILNRLFSTRQGWDGRAGVIEDQVRTHLTDEMAMESEEAVVRRVREIPGYVPLFKRANGVDTIDADRIVKALAAYGRTVLSGDSAYDRYVAGEPTALGPAAIRGLEVFTGKGHCVACHSGVNFTDESYRNTGVGVNRRPPDLGRAEVTNDAADRGKFKVPTLRNVALTAPYMHDGSIDSLAAVVEYYNGGGTANPGLAKEIQPLRLSDAEKTGLIALLESLTGTMRNSSPPVTFPN